MSTDPDQIRADIERTRSELSRDVDTLGDRVRPSSVARRQTDRAKAGASRLRERVMGTAQSTTHHAGESVRGAGESVRDVAGSVGDAVSGAPQTMREQAQGNPLAAGLVAFGVGMVVASLLPTSQKEAQAATKVKEAAEPLVDELKEAGSSMAEDLRGPAQEHAQALRESATEAGRDVAQHGKEAGTDLKDQARGGS